MSGRAVIASFATSQDAIACHHYASKRYPEADIQISKAVAARWPYMVCIGDVVGPHAQAAIAFIKGYAYALRRDQSIVDEVMCKGDERDRYGDPPTTRCECGGFWQASAFVHADTCTKRQRADFQTRANLIPEERL